MTALHVLLASFAFATLAHGQATIKPATFNNMYVPGGFDSNDNVQIVGEGMFRNTCYRPAPTTVHVDKQKKVITVGPAAYEYNGLCLQVILPFDRVMDVGLLDPGTYTINQESDPTVLSTLNVSVAKSANPDEYLYAPISQAFFKEKGLGAEVLLAGDFPTDCMVLDEVKVTVEPKVLVIQPIAKMLNKDVCNQGRFPFNKVVSIDILSVGRYLLHVRSMNGKSINSLVNMD